MWVDFVNQFGRLCGFVHKPYSSMFGSEVKEFERRMYKSGEYREKDSILKNDYYYVDFNFEVDHITAIKNIIQLVDDKEKEIIEKIKILDKQLMR